MKPVWPSLKSMAVICILSLLVVVLSQLPAKVTAQSLELLYSTPLQNRRENRITIGCYQDTSPVNSPNLVFWVRRQGQADQLRSLVTVQQPQPQEVAFVITQDLEGSYFCSLNDAFSNALDLVAYPQANLTIPLFYVFQPGQSATIDCRVMPGGLSQYYSVSWRNGSFQIATSNPRFVFPGYQLHDNFSLTIDNIQTSDSSTRYQCSVTIDDPQRPGSINRAYDQSELGSVTVVVYVAPSIMTPPMQRVIAVTGNKLQSITFVCQATGSPTPQISWLHNGQDVSKNTDERFQAYTAEAGVSRLNISQLRGRDSGSIECVASSMVDIPNRQPLAANDSSITTLSVLTNDFDIIVTVTMDGDVQFMVTPIEDYLIPELTRLRISFTSEEEERDGMISNATSIAAFVNADTIFYQIPNSEVPFQRFRVQVALLVEGKTGPVVPSDLDSALVYDQRAPTLAVTEPCRDPTTLIVGASLAAVVAVLLVIIIVAVVVTCVYCHICKRRECRKLEEVVVKEKWIEMVDANNKAQIRQEATEEQNDEIRRQWSRDLVTKILEDFREMKQYIRDTNNLELFREYLTRCMEMTNSLLKLGSVQVDSDEEWNEEIEEERNNQVLIILKDILKRGKGIRSLKTHMLQTIMDEVGSDLVESENSFDSHHYHAVGSSAKPNIPPPFIDEQLRTRTSSIASPDEHEDDHGFCTNPSCPCQIEHIRNHDKLMFGSQGKLGNQCDVLEQTTASPHLELEAFDYVDPPNSNVHFMDELEVLQCNSNGGKYYNSVHDIHVKVPKYAVPEGMLVKLEIGVAHFGAFLFPVGMKAVSPILWICTQPEQFMFHLPIEIKLPHCLQLTSRADITSLQLGLLKGGHISDGKGDIPFRYSDQATFQPHSSYGIIHIKHFCYLCLTANYASPQFSSKTLFCLIRVVPRPIYSCNWDINFCVAMFLDTCIEAVKQQYPDSMFDAAAPVHFRFKPPEDCHSDPQNSICIKFELNPTGEWMLAEKNAGQLLPCDVVDFENDLEIMKRMHNYKMYPPRFTIEVHGERAIAPSLVKVEFKGVDRNLSTQVILPLPIQPPVHQRITEMPMIVPGETHQQPPTYPTPAAALNSEPKLTDLMDKVAAKIPDQWRDIGIQLGLTAPELNSLPSPGLKPNDYFCHIFTIWKERMIVSYSWRKIIQVLKSPSVGQNRLAADLSAELRASVRRSYRYTSDGSTPRESDSSDGSNSPQHSHVLRESAV